MTKPMARRAIPLLTLAALLGALASAEFITGCGREPASQLKTDTIANESSLPPANPNQLDIAAAPPPPPVATNVVQAVTAPPAVTNTPPPAVAVRTNAAPAGTKEYTVAKGDTLLKIARANGVRFTALSNANKNVNLSKLTVGQKLRIPTGPSASSAVIGFREPGTAGDAAGGNIHVVKAGETLTRIAKENHTTVKALQAANGLKTARVLVGQKLRLPSPAQPGASGGASNTGSSAAVTTPPAPIQTSALDSK